jgi:hypothetical protein
MKYIKQIIVFKNISDNPILLSKIKKFYTKQLIVLIVKHAK